MQSQTAPIIASIVSWVIIIALVFGAVAMSRRSGVGGLGGSLVLRKFAVNDHGSPAVFIEGRRSGIVGWLATMMGLEPLSTLTIDDDAIAVKTASLSGEVHNTLPLTEVSSTHCAYSQPLGLAILGGLFALAGLITSLIVGNGAAFLSGAIVGIICVVAYALNRKIAIVVESTGGIMMGIVFKRSVIEGVDINLESARQVIERLNGLVLERTAAHAGHPF